jgi:hypothetical protein
MAVRSPDDEQAQGAPSTMRQTVTALQAAYPETHQ